MVRQSPLNTRRIKYTVYVMRRRFNQYIGEVKLSVIEFVVTQGCRHRIMDFLKSRIRIVVAVVLAALFSQVYTLYIH